MVEMVLFIPSSKPKLWSNFPSLHVGHWAPIWTARLTKFDDVVTHGGGYPAGAGVPHDDDDDFRGAADIASNHAGDSGDSSFFSGILQSLVDKKQQVAEEDIDEDGKLYFSHPLGNRGSSPSVTSWSSQPPPPPQHPTTLCWLSNGAPPLIGNSPLCKDAVRNHKKFFGNEDHDDQSSSRSMGSAAAMQAMKMFSSGQAGGSNSQSQFVALAMGEASKLFDKQASQGKVANDAGKESAVMQAGEMALKMYMKSQGGGASAGSSSGASKLMGMASKFF